MWFKQIQLLQIGSAISLTNENVMTLLLPFAFRPCLPSMQTSMGWVSPLESEEEEAPLVRTINGYMMFCLQIEDKILPASVIRHELNKKIKQIETNNARKLRSSEKLSLKDEMTMTLLPRAFSKFSKIYAYIDIKNRLLVLGTAETKKAEQFISMLKKSIGDEVSALPINKLSPIITHWIKSQHYPAAFAIEKACVLQDPNQESRIIRCQEQDLFAISIQALVKEGCEVKQLAVNWQDRVSFTLSHDFSLKSIRFQEDIKLQANEMEPETEQQCFDADFLIMSGTLAGLLDDLLMVFGKTEVKAVA